MCQGCGVVGLDGLSTSSARLIGMSQLSCVGDVRQLVFPSLLVLSQ